MTGFSRAGGALGAWSWAWELKSVNGRNFELRFRLPPALEGLEVALRDQARARFSRGNVQAALILKRDDSRAPALINETRLKALAEAARPFVDAGLAAPPRIDGLLLVKGVLVTSDEPADEELEALHAAVLAGFNAALSSLDVSRREEGASLTALLSALLDELEALTKQASGLAAARPEAIRERLKAKIDDLLPQGLDPDRLAQETALLAVKADIREELERLLEHVKSARVLLAGGSPAGRKLDFLSQEFNREANTLCSKSSDSDLTRIGLAMKAAVDQFREQVQNVE
ncbi:MAG: YicC family protein [Maricaulaceae bacterium]|nr:YicC family protein [Maricaulaceae bacterium]